jgi:hypothetical protein
MEYVTVDKESGELGLQLPNGYEKYTDEIRIVLSEEFAFEALTSMTLRNMNQFIINWFENKGITLPAEPAE